MKKFLIVCILLLIIALVLFCGCGKETAATDKSKTDNSIIVVDQIGREVVFYQIPQKIVSLSPSNTELAFALGLEKKIAGVTDYCTYPPEAAEKPKIGGFSSPNLEMVVAMEPDLVLCGNLHDEEPYKLESMGIPVIVLMAKSINDVFDSLELLGTITGTQEKADSLIAELTDRIKIVEEKIAALGEKEKVRVYYEVYADPLMSVGSTSFIHEIIKLAGGINIFADIEDDYPTISSEVAAKREPQVILYPQYHGSEEYMAEILKARPGWADIPAVKEDRVYGVPDDLFSRPGPRVAEAVEKAARLFYPHIFF